MLFARDIAIDLGTANTLVYVKGKGIIMREPSVVAVDIKSENQKVVAVGSEAKVMIGRTPGSISARRPLKDGVIADYEMTADMLRALIAKVVSGSLFTRARVILTVPSGITEVESRAFHNAARSAGARYVSIIEEPMAAAIGAGLPVSEPVGSMVVNIGGGTSEVAVISLGDIVTSNSVRVGGDAMDEAIIAYIRKKHQLLIGERTAEDLKIKIGSAYPYDGEGAMDIKGRNLVDGLPKNVEVTSEEIRNAIADTVSQIADTVCETLEKTPPELASDIMDGGIVLTGGGAMLRGLDKLIGERTRINVRTAENPGDCTVTGAGKCLEITALNINK